MRPRGRRLGPVNGGGGLVKFVINRAAESKVGREEEEKDGSGG